MGLFRRGRGRPLPEFADYADSVMAGESDPALLRNIAELEEKCVAERGWSRSMLRCYNRCSPGS
jgi:hypothetical protein